MLHAALALLLLGASLSCGLGCCGLSGSRPSGDEPPAGTAAGITTKTAAGTPLDTPPALSPLPPGVEVEQRTEEYPITGQSAAQLRQQMNLSGPIDHGQRHDARTDWYVRWSYPFDRAAGSCSTGPLKVSLSIVHVYPHWTPPAGTAPALAQQWASYRKSLETHENGHANHGRSAAKEILEALRTVPSSADCPTVDGQASARGQAVLDRWRQADLAYDARTQHGRTQGAVFP